MIYRKSLKEEFKDGTGVIYRNPKKIALNKLLIPSKFKILFCEKTF